MFKVNEMKSRAGLIVGLIALMLLLEITLTGSIGREGQIEVGQPGASLKAGQDIESPTAKSLIANMSIEEKIGQMILVGFDPSSQNDDAIKRQIQENYIGSVIVWVGVGLPPKEFAKRMNDLQKYGEGTRLKIPILTTADHESGFWSLNGPYTTIFQGNMGCGATLDPTTAHETYRILGTELRALGIHVDFAPVSDVNCNPNNPIIGTRSFGEDPDRVCEFVAEAIKGLHSGGAGACAKHFPGHGDTSVDSHLGLPTVPWNKSRLNAMELKPFKAAIASGTDMIMTAHIAFPAFEPEKKPATLSYNVLTKLLREELGFDGVIITDALAMAGVQKIGDSAAVSLMAVKAGADILLGPPDVIGSINKIKEAVKSGELSEERINQSVMRILRLKEKLGLFENRCVDELNAQNVVGCSEHKEKELEIAEKAVTIVRDGGMLPFNLDATERILVVLPQNADATATPTESILGILPSPSSYDLFGALIMQKHPNTLTLSVGEHPADDDISNAKQLAALAGAIIIPTVNTYQGFHGQEANREQAKLVNELLTTGKPVVAIAFWSPYDILSYPNVTAYVCSWMFLDAPVKATVNVLFGGAESEGVLPVSIPGLYPIFSSANYGAVCGKVMDKDGMGIKSALVTIDGIQWDYSADYIVENITGYGDYGIGKIERGSRKLKVKADGHKEFEAEINISAGGMHRLDVVMEKIQKVEVPVPKKGFIPGFEITIMIGSLIAIIATKTRRRR